MKLKLIFCLCMLPLLCLIGIGNHHIGNGVHINKLRIFLCIQQGIRTVVVPYTYQADRLKSKDYKGVTTKDIVYKKHKDYELILTVDFAETEKPAPFVVYIHGGGWARGNNGSSRSLSQYLAKQKGITGVRVSYTLAPQSDAPAEVHRKPKQSGLMFSSAACSCTYFTASRISWIETFTVASD